MKVAWVLGWAVPEAWFAPMAQAALPRAEHRFFAADASWTAELREGGPWDVVVGYSLGSLLLLERQAEISAWAKRVVLLAPVRAFVSEEGLGGRVARTQVKYLARWLRTDRFGALGDFYARAGLTGCEPSAVSATDEALFWGLEKLAQTKTRPMPREWTGYVGENDALLDADSIRGNDARVNLVKAATHHPEALIGAWAEDLS